MLVGVAMTEKNRANYRNFKEMMDVIHGLRTSGLTNAEIAAIAKPSKRKAEEILSTSSDRTARRIMNAIQAWYGPRKCYKNSRTRKWHLSATDVPEYLDGRELQALNIAIQKLGHNEDLTKPLQSLNAKLIARFDKGIENRNAGNKYAQTEALINAENKRNAIFAFMGPRAHIVTDPHVRDTLEDAIAKNRVISFTYTSKRKTDTHTVHPVGIMIGPSNIYLVSYEVFDNAIADEPAKYILENITNVKCTGERFKKHFDFDIEEYANQFFGVFTDKETYDVVWRANPSVADAVKRFTFHPTQTMTDDPTDGSVIIKFHAGGLRAMATYIFQWGGEIVPLAPAQLVAEYQALLNKCLESVK